MTCASLAYAAIHHPCIRRFWCACFESERVPWSEFWDKWLAWFGPSCSEHNGYHALLTDPAVRDGCQRILTRRLGTGSVSYISAQEINAAFPAHVSVADRLSEIVTCSKHSAVLLDLQPEYANELRGRVKGSSMATSSCRSNSLSAFSSQCISFMSQTHWNAVSFDRELSVHVSELEAAGNLLATLSGASNRSAVHAHIPVGADGRLSLDPADQEADHSLKQDSLDVLLQALLVLKEKIWAITSGHEAERPSPSKLIAGGAPRPPNASCIGKVISLIGPTECGKSAIAAAAASSITSAATKLTTQRSHTTCTAPVRVNLAQCYSLEESLVALSTAVGAVGLARDLSVPFNLLSQSDNPLVVLDNADDLQAEDVSDLVRLLMQCTGNVTIIVTSREPKLLRTCCSCIEEIRPWHHVRYPSAAVCYRDFLVDLMHQMIDLMLGCRYLRLPTSASLHRSLRFHK
jgi:hypothetical protein